MSRPQRADAPSPLAEPPLVAATLPENLIGGWPDAPTTVGADEQCDEIDDNDEVDMLLQFPGIGDTDSECGNSSDIGDCDSPMSINGAEAGQLPRQITTAHGPSVLQPIPGTQESSAYTEGGCESTSPAADSDKRAAMDCDSQTTLDVTALPSDEDMASLSGDAPPPETNSVDERVQQADESSMDIDTSSDHPGDDDAVRVALMHPYVLLGPIVPVHFDKPVRIRFVPV
ncbi:hypothetical protein AURDEDRAFT_159336 [Auricularia subglabra TFB-10046 SS5]|nr:hypothetical protein AURDEDRAFT_159336 [Auricularia subglabra TFB-10046 SS5]